jgi:hypothetical protein
MVLEGPALANQSRRCALESTAGPTAALPVGYLPRYRNQNSRGLGYILWAG